MNTQQELMHRMIMSWLGADSGADNAAADLKQCKNNPMVQDALREASNWQPAEFNTYTQLKTEDFETRLEPHDNVNHPQHYTQGSIECIDAIKASMTMEGFRGFLKGNIIKYVWRYESKGCVESLKKAQWYLNKLIDTF